MQGAIAVEVALRSFRPFRIVEQPPGQQTAAARRQTGPWTLDRARFEADLLTGAVYGKHWPRTLPNHIPFPTSGQSGLRRYRLQYVWDCSRQRLGVISCNPSGATREALDGTLHATVNQADLWGYGGIDQCNITPVYETDSAKVHSTMDLRNRVNWAAIAGVLLNPAVWLAWGSIPSGCRGTDRAAWNAAEDRVLSMVQRRQAEDGTFAVLATRINKGSGYTPPGHPSPRRRNPATPPWLYHPPLYLRVV